MRRTALLTIIMIPELLFAQFNLDATTSAYADQQEMLMKADELFFNGQQQQACSLYDDIFIKHQSNWQYGIRQMRCRSLDESPSPEMIEYLYSLGISKDVIIADTILAPYFINELAFIGDGAAKAGKYKSLLDSMGIADQKVRSVNVSEKEMIRVDSVNYRQLIELFRDTGKFVNSTGSILVLDHALALHPKDMSYVMGLLNEALLNGAIDPETYAIIIDHTFYGIFRCVPFGVFGSDKVKLPRCVDDETTESYRIRLLGKVASESFAR